MGFRRIHEFNLSLLTKLGWKLLSNTDCLWVSQLQNKYIKYGNFISSPNLTSASLLWKGIQKIKPFISACACLKASRSLSSSIWSSNWVLSIPSFKPSPKFPFSHNFQYLQVRDLIDHSSHQNASAIHSLFDSVSAQEILRTKIFTALDPSYIWTPSSSGRLSVSSAYKFITASNSISSTEPSHLWNSLWKLKLNDRLRLFLWKIAWDILPTQMRLGQLLQLNTISSCPLCKAANDSLHHLFFDCFFVRVVWRHSFWPLNSSMFSFSSMMDWVKLIISPNSTLNIPLVDCHKFQIFASVACDILWYYKNKAFHDGITFDARGVSAHINKIFIEHFQAWNSVSTAPVEKWIPSAPNWIKINFDTAIRDTFLPKQLFVVLLMELSFTWLLLSVIPAPHTWEKH